MKSRYLVSHRDGSEVAVLINRKRAQAFARQYGWNMRQLTASEIIARAKGLCAEKQARSDEYDAEHGPGSMGFSASQ